MPKPLEDWTLGELLCGLGESKAGLSAGSAAAVSAALGVEMLALGLGVALRRKAQGRPLPAQTDETDLKALMRQARALQQTLLRAAEADRAAVQECLSVPATARPAALVRLTETPLAAARAIRDALHLAETVRGLIPAPVSADVAAGVLLLEAAFQAEMGSVDSNLSLLPDGSEREALMLTREELHVSLGMQ